MKLVNIANQDRTIFLFCRESDGSQKVYKDNSFYPFYYEPDSKGESIGLDGTKLKKIVLERPNQVSKNRSSKSYSSDIRYPLLYIVNKIDNFEKCPIKYFFIDIEVLIPENESRSLDEIRSLADVPVSCITVYNSLKKEYKQFYLEDYKEQRTINTKEQMLIRHFIRYIQDERPDLWLSWNVSFDYNYLYNRFGKEKFASSISPLQSCRYNKTDIEIHYPDGISICDYLEMFKKVNLRESSYKLDEVCMKHLGQGKVHKEIAFHILSEELKARNLEDVELLVKLENKFRILEYFDEIRRFAKCRWEDLTMNSIILDCVLLDEARKRNIVLPNKKTDEGSDLVGAYRRSEDGFFENIYKADVGSMYPSQIVNFCLDPANIINSSLDENYTVINNVMIKQDPNALIPFITKKLIKIKDDLKAKLKKSDINSEDHKLLQMKYDAYKGLVNSIYGVMGLSTFRLYNNLIASSITFLSRDLLKFVESQMESLNKHVVYTDTDALMYHSDKDEIDLLNNLTQEWGAKYNKSSVNIRFESEGMFTKLLIIGRCHYYGYLKTNKGIKKEIKGIEMKRSSSSKYEAYFQEQLIEKVLNKETKYEILTWINKEKELIKTKDLTFIGFPAKIANKIYENNPIFKRAYANTQEIKKDFKLNLGDSFYYIYVNSLGKDSNGKHINVLAFTKDNYDFIDNKRIDWDELIRRNIDTKSNKLFEALKWDINTKSANVATLF